MDGWNWPSVPKENVITNAGVIITNYVMARTRRVEQWDPQVYKRARQWTTWSQSLAVSLSTPSPDPLKETHRVSSARALTQWMKEMSQTNVPLRKEVDLEFFRRSHFEMLQALLDNSCLPDDMRRMVLTDLPSLNEPQQRPQTGSEQLQKFMGDLASQHGAIDLLLDMNRELDDLLECTDEDGHAEDPVGTEIIDMRRASSLGLVRSKAYASLLFKDLGSCNMNDSRVKWVLETIRGAVEKDLFCLQTLCVIMSDYPCKSLALWLVELQDRQKQMALRLWRMQDHVLLGKVAMKYADFFKAYLAFLVSSLKAGSVSISAEYSLSPSWFTSLTLALDVMENYKLRIRALAKIPRLTVPTKTFLSDQGVPLD